MLQGIGKKLAIEEFGWRMTDDGWLLARGVDWPL
jgi:hypothetical protein